MLDLSHRPRPAAKRTVLPVGFHSLCATLTSIWRRFASSLTLGAGPPTASPFDARSRSATRPFFAPGWTVRKRSAGALTLAPCGKAWE